MDRITDARARDSLLLLVGYCDQPECPGREVEVSVKDYDRTLLAAVTHHGLPCPICGCGLKPHGVRTAAEQDEDERRVARRSVNQQRYERDHGPFIPLAALDDRLPE